jgi:prepilin-type N-terminal cleavage/methylation domain-containing protein
MIPCSPIAAVAFPTAVRLRRAAFTLIEMMLAIAIFAAVLAAIYSTWSAILRSSKAAEYAAAEAQRTRITVNALEQALQSVQFFQANAALYSFECDTSGEDAALSFVARLPTSFPGSGQFEGVRLRRVTFAVEPGVDGSKTLVLRQLPMLALADRMEEQPAVRLAQNLRGFGLDFWGPNSTDWEPEWTMTNQLPRLIRFWLEFGGPSGSASGAELVTRVVPISSVGVPAMLQMGGQRPVGQRGGTNAVAPPAGRGNRGNRQRQGVAPVEP